MWAGNGKHFEVITVRPKTAFRISENRATPKRKSDAQSEFSLNISTTSDNEYSVIGADCANSDRNRNGFLKLRRGRLERNAPDGETNWNYEHAMRALGPIAFCAFLYVLDRTVAGYAPLAAADIDENDLADVLRVTPRCVRGVIDKVIKAGAMSRDAEHYWRLSVHVDCLESLPARRRVHKPRTPKPIAAEVRAPELTAAYVTPAPVEEMHFPEPTAAAPIAEPIAEPVPAPVEEMHFPEKEKDCRPRESYCPWNWTCPHLSSDLTPRKTLDFINIEEPTTTRAVRSSGETENAYLARFSQPATRVGEFLQIDDAAAGRMWAECSAVNPALTPRTLGIVARMKLDEWRRVDDSRPGRRVRSLTGLLIRSMPNAVAGALYLQACELAPAELERDCATARAILAEPAAAPRDRAWARAVLIERDET